MADMYKHTHFAKALELMFPGLKDGKDFVVGQPVDPKTNSVTGSPTLMSWKSDKPRPTDENVNAFFRQNEALVRATVAREIRDSCLIASDPRTVVPPDAPPSVQAKAKEWQDYRQALRDLPNQPNFPFTIVWPVAPSA
ncbi:phage tail assembly chaperone [Burkholderia multivorans]|uniref:XkdW family protein n=1 Tax=Burkholderia multivorans TaxID=87883 RepID=UPI001C265370|nr:phage tail assembly chaperone [Burkholderia multivorans]MBU9552823.1 phage tail assembly chaperone [Burkholderia multivorans]